MQYVRLQLKGRSAHKQSNVTSGYHLSTRKTRSSTTRRRRKRRWSQHERLTRRWLGDKSKRLHGLFATRSTSCHTPVAGHRPISLLLSSLMLLVVDFQQRCFLRTRLDIRHLLVNCWAASKLGRFMSGCCCKWLHVTGSCFWGCS